MQETEHLAWKLDWDKNDNRVFKDLSDETYLWQVNFIWSCFEFSTFIDIGPGVAFSEAWLIRQRIPSIDIIGFEPQIDRFIMLRNSCYPGKLFLNAVSDTNAEVSGASGFRGGKSDFRLDITQEMFNSGAYKPQDVHSTTIDAIARKSLNKNERFFVWADVEGSEGKILEGAKECLSSGIISGFLLELCTSEDDATGYGWKKAVEFADRYGYRPVAMFNVQPTHFDCIFAFEPTPQAPGYEFIPNSEIERILNDINVSTNGVTGARAIKYSEKMNSFVKRENDAR
jgi:FkbM family methyltransferase